MRAQKSGGILFKLAQHLWQIKAHLGLSLLEFIFYSSLSSHIDPTHATRWNKSILTAESVTVSVSDASSPLGYLCGVPATRSQKEAAVLSMYKQKELFL